MCLIDLHNATYWPSHDQCDKCGKMAGYLKGQATLTSFIRLSLQGMNVNI